MDNPELETILREIAKLAELRFDDKIEYVERYDIEQRQVKELIASGICEPWMFDEYFTNYPLIREYVRSRNDKINDGKTKTSIVDLLGTYSSSNGQLTIFVNTCKMVAHALKKQGENIDKKDLTQVVLAHEAAHAVTHHGRDDSNNIWSNFESASSENKEMFAQIYALKYLSSEKRTQAIAAFKKLADRQSDKYNSWRDLESLPISNINKKLLEVRRQEQPEKIELDNSWVDIDEKKISEIVSEIMDAMTKEELSISSFMIGRGGCYIPRLGKILKGIEKLPSGANVNVIPSKMPGTCTPILIVLVNGTITDFDRKLKLASDFVLNKCPMVRHIIIWTPIWYSSIWRNISPNFTNQTVSIKIFGLNGQTIQSNTKPQLKPSVGSSGLITTNGICEKCGTSKSIHRVKVSWLSTMSGPGAYHKSLCDDCLDILAHEIRDHNTHARNCLDVPFKQLLIDGKGVYEGLLVR